MDSDALSRWVDEQAPELPAHRLRVKLREERAAHRRTLGALAQAEKKLRLALDIRKQPRKPRPIKARKLRRGKAGEALPIFCATDWHLGELVDPETIGGANEYSPEIAEQRIRRFWLRAAEEVQALRQRYRVDTLCLWLGGDMIAGHLREEDFANPLTVTEQVTLAQRLIHQGVEFLLKRLDPRRLVVQCSYGNHGRLGEKRVAGAERHNLEVLLYHSLARLFSADRRVGFRVARGAQSFSTIYDQRIRWTHGDLIRARSSSSLQAGIRRTLTSWDRIEPASFTVCGHFHTALSGGDWFACSSPVGWGQYAESIGARRARPGQTMLVVEPERGVTRRVEIEVLE